MIKSRSDVDAICRRYGITNYTIHDDMSISVNGSFDLYQTRISRLGNTRASKLEVDKIPLKFKEVTGDFRCDHSNLETLEGCPERVGGEFYCTINKLKSLEFCPKEVGGIFVCYMNEITNFDGLPEFFESDIWIYGNPVYEIYTLFESDQGLDPKCIYYIREFDVIQGNRVIKDRLEEVYVHMGMKMPKNIKFEEYILV